MGKPVKPSPPITFTLTGGTSTDILSALNGQLKLNGVQKDITPGATKITLNGGDGNDTIVTDAIHTNGGVPIFYDGGKGSDTIDFSASSEAIAVSLFQGTKPGTSQPWLRTDFSLEPNAVLFPEYYSADDPSMFLVTSPQTVTTSNLINIENVVGSAFDDWIHLGTSAATADGGAGNDYVQGWSGPDILLGGSGDDFLFGKGGNDTMTGGTGADQFQVLAWNGVDVITDFDPAEDHLYIGWQQNASEVASASNWYATTWTDFNGVVHYAIEADFEGGGVILVGHTLESVLAVMASTTTFDWFG